MQGLTANDILIIGDSFARCRELTTDWPMLLQYRLTGSTDVPRGQGFSGASWWSVRKCLLTEMKKMPIRLLIICHTDPFRLPSDDDLGINLNSVATRKISNKGLFSVDNELIDAAYLYYNKLMSTDFHEWARNRWFEELESLTINIEKVIHIHCFQHCDFYQFKTGITITNRLSKYAVFDDPDMRNHFTVQRNCHLAYELVQLIQSNNTKTPQRLNL